MVKTNVKVGDESYTGNFIVFPDLIYYDMILGAPFLEVTNALEMLELFLNATNIKTSNSGVGYYT